MEETWPGNYWPTADQARALRDEAIKHEAAKREAIQAAREEKVAHFVDVIMEVGIPTSLIEDLDLSGWRILTKWVNWKFKSNHSVPSVESEQMIYEELKKRGYGK